jgi:hypothetical protein
MNSMTTDVDVPLYSDHDRTVKLLHALDHTVWDGKVGTILESEKYTTLTVTSYFLSSSLLRLIVV